MALTATVVAVVVAAEDRVTLALSPSSTMAGATAAAVEAVAAASELQPRAAPREAVRSAFFW